MISVDFNIPGEKSVKERLVKGYRGRRNFLIAELLQMLVDETPVKTGKARGGWRVSVGSVPSGDIDRLDPSGVSTVPQELSNLKGGSVFSPVYLSNLTPYFPQLEEGSSSQAPLGIVKVVVPAFRSRFRDVE